MIFVTVGSREYQFDRLIKKLDELVFEGLIEDEIFAQIGQSSFIPKNFKYTRYMSADDFKINQKSAKLVISHGGTGTLVNTLKLGKKIIAVPRLEKFGEHIDDHQIQVARVLEKEGYLHCVLDINNLIHTIEIVLNCSETKKFKKPSNVINIIESFMNNEI